MTIRTQLKKVTWWYLFACCGFFRLSGATVGTDVPAASLLPGQDVTVSHCIGRVHDSNGNNQLDASDMRYRVFIPPNYNPSLKYPVIMWLHGLGAEGTDNVTQLVGEKGAVLQLLNGANRYNYPCILIAPQRQNGEWYGSNYDNVFGILQDVASQYSVDRKRIYLTGVSFGAFGTYAFLTHRSDSDPFHWAAGVPIAGNGGHDNAWQFASSLVGFPLWAFHANDDGTVDIYDDHGSDVMMDMIRQGGGSPMYTRYNSGNHTLATWGCAYATPSLLPWLMSQRLDNETVSATGMNEKTSPDPGVVVTGYRVGATLDMEGTLSAVNGSPTEVGFWNSTIGHIRSGTATMTGASTTVTFSSGSFTAADIGKQLFLKNNAFDTWNGYVITTVTSSTVIKVLSSNTGKGIGNGTFSNIDYDINPPGYRLYPQVASGTSAWNVNGIPLVPGSNVIGMSGKGSSYPTGTQGGNTFYNGPVLTIPYAVPSGDAIAPVLTAGGPVLVTSQSGIVLSGTATDNTGVSSVTWTTDHLGSGVAALSGTSWTTGSIPLDPGNNIVTVKAQDSAGNIAVKILRVVYNVGPVAPTHSISTPRETGVTIDVLGSALDSDMQPQILSISAVGNPSHGTAGIYDGKVRYMPAPGYSDADSFTYTVTDGTTSATGQINVQVSGTMTNSGTIYFSQDFSSGTTLTDYYTVNSPSTHQFNDISAEGNGGALTLAGDSLVLTRAVSATPDNGAGLIRYTDLAGPPQFVKISFGYSLTGTTTTNSAVDFELANLTSKGDYSNSLNNSVVANRLTLTGKGAGVMAYVLGGLTSPTINADGTFHQVAWYVNGSSQAKQYVGPDGYIYPVSANSSSLWIDGVLSFNNLGRGSYTGTSMADFRIRTATTNPITFTLTDFSMQEQIPTIVPDIPASLPAWRQSVGLAADGSQDLETPAGDGVSNLMKYAVNLASTAGALSQPAYGISSGGTSGLPILADQENGTLSFMFVRRKASTAPGISYGIEQSTNLQSWSAFGAVPLVESIDSTWERVTYTLDPDTAPHIFLRLKVGTP